MYYLLIKFCSVNSTMFYMEIEFLNFSERPAFLPRNRNWIPVKFAQEKNIVILRCFVFKS